MKPRQTIGGAMAGQGKSDSEQAVQTTPTMRYKTRATYDTLMRQSRKMGERAMKTLDEAGKEARERFGPPRQKAAMAEDIEHLKEVVAHSREVIISAKTVLPFIFRDEVCLDRTKITITKRKFFWSEEVLSIRIEDILNVSISVGPIFGSITIASRVMSSVDHFEINDFWRDDAINVKQIIQGYLIARQNGLQTDHLSCEELVDTLKELGNDG